MTDACTYPSCASSHVTTHTTQPNDPYTGDQMALTGADIVGAVALGIACIVAGISLRMRGKRAT